MLLKKFWFRLFNKRKYQEIRYIEKKLKSEIFLSKFLSKSIRNIAKKIESKKKLNLLHSGHAADIINILPVVKELSKNHECNLYINLNKKIKKFYYKHPAGKFFINRHIYDMLLPLLLNQKYLKNVEIFTNQSIDINFDLFRDLPINLLFDNLTYASTVTGIQPDFSKPFLEAQKHKLQKKIIIQRSFRYRNNFIDYKFLNNYDNLYYVGTQDEFKDLKKKVKNLNFYECKNFLDMANIVKSSKFVLVNSSITFSIAEGLNVPRLLESSPEFPAAQPHGNKAFNFYFQSHFESKFKYLYNN